MYKTGNKQQDPSLSYAVFNTFLRLADQNLLAAIWTRAVPYREIVEPNDRVYSPNWPSQLALFVLDNSNSWAE